MKKVILIVCFLIFLSSVCYGDTLNTQYKKGSTLKWTPASTGEISSKANGNSSYGSSNSILQDPLVNGAMNGYYNMMQGMSGNPYNMREIQKQQADYAKQQMQNSKQTDESE
jgi:hypothetical protein